MKKIVILIAVVIFLSVNSYAVNLQSIIDKSAEGAAINLKKGNYTGNVVIIKTLTLNCNGAVINAHGKGDVLVIKRAKDVVIKNCVLQNSGSSGWKMDAGVQIIGAKGTVLKNNTIENCLYGIVAKSAKKTMIEGNDISSKPYSEGVKGDAIRLWWSSNSVVKNNKIHNSRDVVSLFSNNVIFDSNRASYSHIGVMVQNSNNNKILNFKGYNNEVNILLNSADNTVIKDFSIKNKGKFRGIALIRASNTLIENGSIEQCNKGLVINLSPAKSGSKNYLKNIRIRGNNIGIYLHTTAEQRDRNILKKISYEGNKVNLMDEWKTHK